MRINKYMVDSDNKIQSDLILRTEELKYINFRFRKWRRKEVYWPYIYAVKSKLKFETTYNTFI